MAKTSFGKARGVAKPIVKPKVISRAKALTSKRRPSAGIDKLTSHILFLFCGKEPPRSLMTVHTSLVPPTSKTVLDNTGLQHGFYVLEDDLELAKIWRHFLYFDEICTKQQHPAGEWEWLADAYLLGVVIKDERFCNAVIDAFVEKQLETDEYPTTLASAVFTNTGSGDCLRKLVIDMHVWAGHGAGLSGTEDAEEAPVQFHRAVRYGVRQLGSRINDPKEQYPWLTMCKYHKHKTTEKCSA